MLRVPATNAFISEAEVKEEDEHKRSGELRRSQVFFGNKTEVEVCVG